MLADDLGHRLRADQVVDHGPARVTIEQCRRHDRGRGRAGQGVAALVDEEHAIGVAVEGEPHVGAGLDAPGPAGRAGSPAGSGRRGGSGTCRRAPGTAPRARRAGRGRPPARRGRPCRSRCRPRRAAVAGRRRRRRSGRGRRRRPAGRPRCGCPGDAAGANSGPPASSRMRPSPLSSPTGRGPGQAHLDAVVARRVVAGGEHRAGRVEPPGGEVEQVGRDQPDVGDVEALGEDAGGECGDQLGARRAHVTRHDQPGGAGRLLGREAGERRADATAERRVDLVGVGPPDVVRLEDLVECAHGGAHATGETSALRGLRAAVRRRDRRRGRASRNRGCGRGHGPAAAASRATRTVERSEFWTRTGTSTSDSS